MLYPLTGLLRPDSSPIDHLWNIRDQRVHCLYPFRAATLIEPKRQLVEQWRRIAFHWVRGVVVQMYTQVS